MFGVVLVIVVISVGLNVIIKLLFVLMVKRCVRFCVLNVLVEGCNIVLVLCIVCLV